MIAETLYFNAKVKFSIFWVEKSIRLSSSKIEILRTEVDEKNPTFQNKSYDLIQLRFFYRFDTFSNFNLFEFQNDGKLKRRKTRIRSSTWQSRKNKSRFIKTSKKQN